MATGAGAGLCESNGVEDCSACDEGFDFFLGGIAAAGTLSTCDGKLLVLVSNGVFFCVSVV